MQGFKHDGYYVVVFRQDYHSDLLKSSGVKRLYLQEGDEELKIIGEVWNPLRGGYLSSREKTSVQIVSSKRQDDLKSEAEKIESFIEKWRRCWEDKELETYIRCYSENFKARGMDRKEWKNLKQILNDTYKNIKVNITDAEINIKDGGKKAEVSFLQDYQADHYSDKGLKRMLLEKEEGKWKIVTEEWSSL
jgi:ketosteroid isomerase-like protein